MVEARSEAGLDRGSALGLALVVAVLAMLGTAGAAPAATVTEFSAGITPGINGGPPILATGDSMMRYLDGRLEGELKLIQEVSFHSDVRIGSEISKDHWVRRARQQVRKYQPRATVIFMGAAEGFNMPHARCCGKAWVAEYADRVEKMIRSYSRKGRAEVYWLTLPAPRDARRDRIFAQVNRAIRRAVRTSGPHAHLVDAWAVLTPRGRYRRTMLWEGRRVVVRTRDGAHLASAGHAIVTPLILDAMRKDGLVP